MSGTRPLRAHGIEVVPTADGYVVYDAERDRVHYLNHTAAQLLDSGHLGYRSKRVLAEARAQG